MLFGLREIFGSLCYRPKLFQGSELPFICENMTDIKEGQTLSFQQAPEELKELLRGFVHMCAFRKVPVKSDEALRVQLTRQKEGWLFTCRVCPQMECTGFLRDKLSEPPTESTELAKSKA